MKRKDYPLYKKLQSHNRKLGYLEDSNFKENCVSVSNSTKFSKNCQSFCITFFGLLFVYSIGYRNGINSSSDVIPKNEINMDNLKAIEHMQGISVAYPTYELQSDSSITSSKATNKMADISVESELEEDQYDEKVTITNDFTDEELFENYRELQEADYITVPDLQAKYNLPYKLPRKNLWWGLKEYEDQYRKNPIKNIIPRLKRNVQLTVEEFHNRFRKQAQPVVFNFENLRDLGFKTQNYSIAELKLMFPFDESKSMTKVRKQFVANGIRRADEELDLGPGLVAIERDEELSKKGKLRSFPRNLKVKLDAIEKLNIERPPLLKDEDNKDLWQLPTIWMGTSSSDTRLHHDCCDNFVMMITGTKRFTLAPTSDWRILKPNCVGKLKSLCWANINDPNERLPGVNKNKARAALQYMNKFVVDVQPGDVLYMPAGWFHHIQNLGPTLMVNWWTKGSETCGLLRARNNPDY